MSPETQKMIGEIWATLHAMAERENQIEQRFDRRMEKIEQSFDRRMEKIERTHQLAMERLDRYDRSLEGIRKLLIVGAKTMIKMQAETRELKKAQKAFLESFRNGGGNGRRHAG